MTSRERLLAALNLEVPDRLPATTHHVIPYFLEKYMKGISYPEFFEHFGLDPVFWITSHKPDTAAGDYCDPAQGKPGFLQPRRICSANWRIKTEKIPHPKYNVVRYLLITPKKTLTMVLESDAHTTWVSERMIKEKTDIEILAEYAPAPLCDVEAVNRQVAETGGKGMIRGTLPGFDIYGQPGCWQDAAVLFGVEALIMQTFEDPEWVHFFLKIMQQRKEKFANSLKGAQFDLIEHGGGDASSTVISPKIFDEFVAPYDAPLIDIMHRKGQKVVYHTCGGMMPLLERIADMNPDAAETFTPVGMGGDVDLRKAKKRIGHRMCMIGGFDQFHYFVDCKPEDTRREVRRCFEEAGEGGGFILSPSDHFFDAEPELIQAYADTARQCIY